MKRTLVVAATILTLLFSSASLFAGVPAKTELAFSGSYVNPAQGSAIWQLGAEMLFPVTDKGILVIGPAVAVSDNDENTGGGATIEFNLAGKNVGPFFGANGLYFLDSADGQDDYSVDARAGLKIPISSSGLFKVYAQYGLNGRSEDTDLTGALAAVIRF